jgi:hypothetical protein
MGDEYGTGAPRHGSSRRERDPWRADADADSFGEESYGEGSPDDWVLPQRVDPPPSLSASAARAPPHAPPQRRAEALQQQPRLLAYDAYDAGPPQKGGAAGKPPPAYALAQPTWPASPMPKVRHRCTRRAVPSAAGRVAGTRSTLALRARCAALTLRRRRGHPRRPHAQRGTRRAASKRGSRPSPVATASAYLFQPQGRFMRKWNLLLVVLMIFTAVVTPYEVAFLSSGPTEPIFWVDRVVDFLFFIDIFVTMNLVYFDDSAHHLIQDRDAIMRKCVHVRVVCRFER